MDSDQMRYRVYNPINSFVIFSIFCIITSFYLLKPSDLQIAHFYESKSSYKKAITYYQNVLKNKITPDIRKDVLQRLATLYQYTNQPKLYLCQVDRVDPVKDIKTFIQVVANIKQFIPNIKVYVVGPTDEDLNYYNECINLRDMLNLNNTITFTGRADVVQYYKIMDVLILTSIKEAMPLVIMEGMASGLPVVSTKVGACEELIYGINDGIGPAGYVAAVMNVQDITLKTIKILRNKDMANQMGINGIKRIESFYHEEMVKKSYEKIYNDLINFQSSEC